MLPFNYKCVDGKQHKDDYYCPFQLSTQIPEIGKEKHHYERKYKKHYGKLKYSIDID
jgi:hypothetical protein